MKPQEKLPSPPAIAPRSRIFMSYSRESRVRAERIAEDMERLDFEVWFDREIPGGREWWDLILERIRDCDLFVVLLEPWSLDSEACEKERLYALSLNKPVLPIKIRACKLPKGLSNLQCVDYRRRNASAAIDLAKTLYLCPKAAALPATLPAPPDPPQPRPRHIRIRDRVVCASLAGALGLLSMWSLIRGGANQLPFTSDSATLYGLLFGLVPCTIVGSLTGLIFRRIVVAILPALVTAFVVLLSVSDPNVAVFALWLGFMAAIPGAFAGIYLDWKLPRS